MAILAYAIASVIAFAGVFFNLSYYGKDVFLIIFYTLVGINLVFLVTIHLMPEITITFAKRMLIFQLIIWFVGFSITLFFMADLKFLLLIASIMAFTFSLSYLKFKISLLFVCVISATYFSISYIGINYFQHPGTIEFEALVLISYIPVCIFVAYMADRENSQRRQLKHAFENIERVTQEREKIMQQLKQVASTDELTGLLNRRAMNAKLEEEMKRFYRYHISFCILLLDIDYFKKINDEYGHQIGDLALIHLAKTMQSAIRETDTLSRWGGEEFMVLLPATPIESARVIAERLCLSVEQSTMEIDQATIRCTISGGLSKITANQSLEQAIQIADTMLYQAKAQGRNQIAVSANT
ncbi:diguanylate cyclase [Aliikangiella marina]|uniref:diguanylate cyclase n=1 Tax=Aliikangiella marina TaxID=1712262 RepID=A0A545TJ42_9GAMM|nr:GGDEF domain-containing protein [Aliikangiella marina]TQV77223.1 diguanylate cyclase [Aliikangiella marina]